MLFKAFYQLLPSNVQKSFTTKKTIYGLRGYGHFSILNVRNTQRFCVKVCGVKLWNGPTTQAIPKYSCIPTFIKTNGLVIL